MRFIYHIYTNDITVWIILSQLIAHMRTDITITSGYKKRFHLFLRVLATFTISRFLSFVAVFHSVISLDDLPQSVHTFSMGSGNISICVVPQSHPVTHGVDVLSIFKFCMFCYLMLLYTIYMYFLAHLRGLFEISIPTY